MSENLRNRQQSLICLAASTKRRTRCLIRCMKFRQVTLALLLLTGARAQLRQQDSEPHWQKIDQLCGQLQFVTPKENVIGMESRFRVAYLMNADLSLYVASPKDNQCCGTKTLATVQSDRYGSFRFRGIGSGNYWLRVQKDGKEYIVPLEVTADFNQKTCLDPSVARDVVVDSKPPSVQVRIR